MKTFRRSFCYFIPFLIFGFLMASCKKVDDWLDKKSNLSHVRPSSLDDFRAILDEDNQMNSNWPTHGLAGTDNYYLSDQNFTAAAIPMRNLYIWAKDIYNGGSSGPWNSAYRLIERTNIVIDGLKNLGGQNENTEYKAILGTALFFRAFAHYNIAQAYCLPFTPQNAHSRGVVLRLTSDVNVKSERSSILDSYSQILDDLHKCIELLPLKTPFQTRPNKTAGYALLAKVYLVMEDYQNAFDYSNNAISSSGGELLDYNNEMISEKLAYRFPTFGNNPEIIFYSKGTAIRNIGPQTNAHGFVDTILFSSYAEHDLRKKLIFIENSNGTVQFRGTYSGDNTIFSGIALNEVYLIRMESAVRLNNIDLAREDLNTLLIHRYLKGSYSQFEFETKEQLLAKILEERRKELPFTSQIRWEDLRRLNHDQKFAITILRNIGGVKYELPPNDKRYVLPIPDEEIQLSGIKQNER